MHFTTFLFAMVSLLSSAHAQGELFDKEDRYDATPSNGCYCKLPEKQFYSNTDIKELGITKYCCDGTAGVDDPTHLKPGEVGNWDNADRSCNKAVVGLGADQQDNFAKCCAGMLLQSSCADPNRPLYTRVQIKGVDGKNKLTFGDVQTGDKPFPYPMPDLSEIKLAPEVQ